MRNVNLIGLGLIAALTFTTPSATAARGAGFRSSSSSYSGLGRYSVRYSDFSSSSGVSSSIYRSYSPPSYSGTSSYSSPGYRSYSLP